MPDEAEPKRRRRGGPELTPEEEARQDAEAVRLGRFLPLGMMAGAAAGGLVGWLVHHPGICIPVGIALGILLAGTIPVFSHRR